MIRSTKKSYYTIVATMILSVFAFSSLSIVAFAQNAGGEGGASLQISPVLFEETLQPGESKEETINLTNTSNKAVSIVSEVGDFYYDESGQMKFIEETENNPSTASLKKWLSYNLKDFTLQPGEQKKMKFMISPPTNADTGGHYGVMFFRSVPNEGGTVAISSRIGALVLITIPGNVKKTGEISNLKVGTISTEKKSLTEQSFFSAGPVGFSFSVLNSGNAHFKPQGKITITNMFGKVVEEVSAQDTRSFPAITRTYLQSATLNPWGWYEATANFKDGDGNQMKILTVKFWGFNYRLVIQWTILIIVVIILLVLGLKKYNTWIIKQASAQHHTKK